MTMPYSGPATVLVVDDIPTKRYILASWLRRAGHHPVEAAGGLEALKLVEDIRPDLVVLDVRLPDIDGFAVCEKIKDNPDTSSIPVIQVSGNAITAADRAEGLDRGADAYMVEPIEPAEFVATVEATLRYYRARQRAERVATRLGQLAEVTLRINRAESFDQLLQVAVEGAAEMLRRHAGAMALPPDGRVRRYAARPGRSAISKVGSPRSLTMLNDMSLRDGTGDHVFTVDRDRWLELMPDADISTAVSIVLCRTKPGRPPISVGVEADPPLDSDELTLLRQLGQALALAVDALGVYTEEHTIAVTLQRSLLPSKLPDLPGLRMSARYHPAAANVEIGGDFYEVLPLDDRVLVAIGDVQGHSLYAATVMAELRNTLRASMMGPVDLGGTLNLLNAVLLRYHPSMTATVCLLLVEPESGRVDVANAGHIPPLIVGDGGARYHRFGNLLLGVGPEEYRVDRLDLLEGDIVVMFTDGLVEHPDRLLDEGLDMVRHLADTASGDLEGFCDRLIARYTDRQDDVALVVLQRVPC
ncbi:Serine phosphatase RsbU, regulator of sigma subunit [Thermostaphylospora chromogena]|uniref:Serine phosphatase RsbU, regulator of sigma subunit n=2 Tax=Thermostaphylospora chromogena TaxID=35622 RepID=A0A1H1CPJ9_9ACTN|nr:Serine phosphatase RsbU, regulator of sigma subunit [Thermostaphylospora chromogena]